MTEIFTHRFEASFAVRALHGDLPQADRCLAKERSVQGLGNTMEWVGSVTLVGDFLRFR